MTFLVNFFAKKCQFLFDIKIKIAFFLNKKSSRKKKTLK